MHSSAPGKTRTSEQSLPELAIIAAAEDRMLERLERGIEGYTKISRHALNAEASAQLIAELDSESADSEE
jgi:hypothetical protein